jgi:hypothetical protein
VIQFLTNYFNEKNHKLNQLAETMWTQIKSLLNYWLQNLEENIVWQTKIIYDVTVDMQKGNKINKENQRDKNQLKLIEELQRKNVRVKKNI